MGSLFDCLHAVWQARQPTQRVASNSMPTASAPGSTFSRASALPVTASDAPATAAPFKSSRLEIDIGAYSFPWSFSASAVSFFVAA